MKSLSKFLGAMTVAFFALTNAVMAAPCEPGQTEPCTVPEPSSLALVGLALAGAVWVAYKAKK